MFYSKSVSDQFFNHRSFGALTSGEAFGLLDDAHSADKSSRLYTGLRQILTCQNAQEWQLFWDDVQQALQEGWYAVALLSYDTGMALHGLPLHPDATVSRMLLFRHCQILTQQDVAAFLQAQIGTSELADIAGVAGIGASVDEAAFLQSIAKVRVYIAAGDTYQVNYTYRLHFDTYGSPVALYQRLRQRQPVPYGALICLPGGESILSLSPELFVRHRDGKLLARPMKGTAAATGEEEQDQLQAKALAEDPKNRAENLMIVDLLRNDLGRIAATGSVQVPSLFDVNRFSSVLQMTSTIEARLAPETDLADIFSALFPCGSITGAPKRRTMQIIDELETEPRGIYTGAIGWFDPGEPRSKSTPAFCLSVPIRTLRLQPGLDVGTGSPRRGVMGVGAGIVHDSVAPDEFAECQLKSRFLTGLWPQFELIETMYASRENGCRYLDRHLQRMRSSARYFGFHWDEQNLRTTLKSFCDNLPEQSPFRLRLALSADGTISLQHGPLHPLRGQQFVLLAQTTTQSNQLFLRHKTSLRAQYDQAWKLAEKSGAFDMLFFNEQGHLTEGGRSTVLLQKDGQWLTPPLSDGVLPGIMRAVMLEDPHYAVREQSLTRADVLSAEKLMLCNALRGAFDVSLLAEPASVQTE